MSAPQGCWDNHTPVAWGSTVSSLIGVELFGVIARHCGCTPAGFKGKCVFRCFHNPVYWFRALSPSSQGCLAPVPVLAIPPLPTFDPLPSSYKNPVITLDLPTKSRIIALFFSEVNLWASSEHPWACSIPAGPMGSLVSIFGQGALLGQPQTYVFSKPERKGAFKPSEKRISVGTSEPLC